MIMGKTSFPKPRRLRKAKIGQSFLNLKDLGNLAPIRFRNHPPGG